MVRVKVWLLACNHWGEATDKDVRNEEPGVFFEVYCHECTTNNQVVGYGWELKHE